MGKGESEYYEDLRAYIKALEAHDKLVRIKREINKDTELHPLVRWQFRGLPDEQRRAFLFENIVDAKGKKFTSPVIVACHAASTEVYALAMMCKPEEIPEKWNDALLHPVEPVMVKSGPVHEEVHMGDNLLEHGGLGEFPIPISTPGFDNAPYLTAGCWVTKDPETGIRNVGVHRAMVKSPSRLGVMAHSVQHLSMHYEKYKAKGIPMPAAVVIGPTPNIGLCGVTKVPYRVDEFAVAGRIADEPVKLVKCKTVDIEVPATAEIVIEGELPIDYLERDAPFGEFTGYMGWPRVVPYFNVSCITHRKTPVWTAFLSQFPPSESSMLRGTGRDASYYKFLKHACGIQNLVDVYFHRESGSGALIVLRLKRTPKTEDVQVWQALHAASAADPSMGKIIIAVDEDIDPKNIDSVMWALCYRMQPNRDMATVRARAVFDHSIAPPEAEDPQKEAGTSPSSALLIDATLKWTYPPVALPKKEFMERAREIWEEEGLPKLSPRAPWYGVSLGRWPEEYEEEAELAIRGEHYKTGEKLAKRRVKAELTAY
jgi:UbiD family decarboxylase